MKQIEHRNKKAEKTNNQATMTKISVTKRKTFQGTVVSTKNKDTVGVLLLRFVQHPIYGKPLRRTNTLLAHNKDFTLITGDSVIIEVCGPVSKRKHFRVIEKLS